MQYYPTVSTQSAIMQLIGACNPSETVACRHANQGDAVELLPPRRKRETHVVRTFQLDYCYKIHRKAIYFLGKSIPWIITKKCRRCEMRIFRKTESDKFPSWRVAMPRVEELSFPTGARMAPGSPTRFRKQTTNFHCQLPDVEQVENANFHAPFGGKFFFLGLRVFFPAIYVAIIWISPMEAFANAAPQPCRYWKQRYAVLASVL